MLLQKESSAIITLAQNAVYAMLLETACHPSPGLVSPKSVGSHKDMNYFTFLSSSSALAPYYLLLAEAGFRFQGQEEKLLTELRAWGLRAETDMFAATGGANTQKAAPFFPGTVCRSGRICVASWLSSHCCAGEGSGRASCGSVTRRTGCYKRQEARLPPKAIGHIWYMASLERVEKRYADFRPFLPADCRLCAVSCRLVIALMTVWWGRCCAS